MDPAESTSYQTQSSDRRIFSPHRAIFLVVIIAAIASFWIHSSVTPSLRFTGSTMGTTYSVTCILDEDIDPNGSLEAQLAGEIDACLEQVNAMMSTYRPDSELSRLNQHTEQSPFSVSPPLIHVLGRAIELSKLTDGAFDVTVGPIVNAYGFGPTDKPVRLPTDEELDQLKPLVGYRMINLDTDAGTVTKERPDLYIDLSAIAKGYAVDQVASLLEKHNMANYLVEVGGEIRVKGHNLQGDPWRIGVEKPDAPTQTIQRVLLLRDIAMATSGDYRNYYMTEGRRISHTIDPRTGKPVAHNLASVTVLAQDCETADALATALLVLGTDAGYNLAENQGLAALFLIRQSHDVYVEKETSGFATAMTSSDAQEPKNDLKRERR